MHRFYYSRTVDYKFPGLSGSKNVKVLCLIPFVIPNFTYFVHVLFFGLGICGEPRLWNTRRTCEKCLLGLPLSKWCHGIERGILSCIIVVFFHASSSFSLGLTKCKVHS